MDVLEKLKNIKELIKEGNELRDCITVLEDLQEAFIKDFLADVDVIKILSNACDKLHDLIHHRRMFNELKNREAKIEQLENEIKTLKGK